jgi:hypothetical protein
MFASGNWMFRKTNIRLRNEYAVLRNIQFPRANFIAYSRDRNYFIVFIIQQFSLTNQTLY